ncbi:MAG: hypothetical protein RXN77_02830 [Sulfolobaceae archaeon]|jgi:hypothetical protein|nr:hypothetical protein [Sulfolobales archaeon]
MMNLIVFVPITIGFVANLIVYVLYKTFLEDRFSSIINEIIKLETKLYSSASEKRKMRKQKLKKDELQTLYSTFRWLSFLQTSTLMASYFVGFLIVASYFNDLQLAFPSKVPVLTNNNGLIYGGSVLLYILSFFVFVPLGLRRPKLF